MEDINEIEAEGLNMSNWSHKQCWQKKEESVWERQRERERKILLEELSIDWKSNSKMWVPVNMTSSLYLLTLTLFITANWQISDEILSIWLCDTSKRSKDCRAENYQMKSKEKYSKKLTKLMKALSKGKEQKRLGRRETSLGKKESWLYDIFTDRKDVIEIHILRKKRERLIKRKEESIFF